MIVFETCELILCQMLSSQGKNAPSNPYPHYLVRLATSRILRSHALSTSFFAVDSRAFCATRTPYSHNNSYVHYSLNSLANVLTRMYIRYSRRMVQANAAPFTCLLVNTNTGACHQKQKTNRNTNLIKGGEQWCDVRGPCQSQITRTTTIHFLLFTVNGSQITPITFTHSLRSREVWPLR